MDIKPIYCKLNALSRSDGSVLLTHGQTVVLASVNGPIEVFSYQNLRNDKAFVDVNYSTKSGQTNVDDRLQETIIRETCETAVLTLLHPRTAITIQLQEVEDNGGLLACAINASCLALLNSGLPMRFLIAAVNCAITDGDTNHIIINPSENDLKQARADLTFVFDSVAQNTVAVHSTGNFTIGEYNDALIVCRDAIDLIFRFYRETIERFFKK